MGNKWDMKNEERLKHVRYSNSSYDPIDNQIFIPKGKTMLIFDVGSKKVTQYALDHNITASLQFGWILIVISLLECMMTGIKFGMITQSN